MTSLMEVTLLIASTAPEILSPELWVLNPHHTVSDLAQVVFYLSENSMHQLDFCNKKGHKNNNLQAPCWDNMWHIPSFSVIVTVSLSKPVLNFEDLSVNNAGCSVPCAAWPSRQQRKLTGTELMLGTSSFASSTVSSLQCHTFPTGRSCWSYFLRESSTASTSWFWSSCFFYQQHLS